LELLLEQMQNRGPTKMGEALKLEMGPDLVAPAGVALSQLNFSCGAWMLQVIDSTKF
jgi:hypothetical protein